MPARGLALTLDLILEPAQYIAAWRFGRTAVSGLFGVAPPAGRRAAAACLLTHASERRAKESAEYFSISQT